MERAISCKKKNKNMTTTFLKISLLEYSYDQKQHLALDC